jgi:hypothetical protein
MLGLTSKIAEDSLNFVYDDKINPNSPAYKELQDLMEDHKYFQKRMKNIENNYKAGDIYRNETQYLEAKNKVQESINSIINRIQQITGDVKSTTVKGYKYDADPKATDLKPKADIDTTSRIVPKGTPGSVLAMRGGDLPNPFYYKGGGPDAIVSISKGSEKANIAKVVELHKNWLETGAVPDGLSDDKIKKLAEMREKQLNFIDNLPNDYKLGYYRPDATTSHAITLDNFIQERKQNVTPEVKAQTFETIKRYDEDILRANPDKIYIFGDNEQRVGKGGQAIIRDEPNAFGIATKKQPNMKDGAFFTDDEFETNKKIIDEDIAKIKADGRPIVFPEDGIGTGRGDLKNKAPKTYEYLMGEIEKLKGDTPEVKAPLPDNVVESTEDFKRMFNRYGPGGMPPLDTPEFATWYEKEIEGKSSTEIIDDVAKNADVEPSLLRKTMGEVPGFLVVPLEAAIEVGLRYGRLGKSFPNVAKNARRFIMYELAMFAGAVVTGVVTYGANKFRAETGFDSREIYTPYSYKGTDEANQKMEEAVAYNAEIQKIYEEYPELKEYNEAMAHQFAMEKATENMDFFIKKMPTYYIDELLFEYVPELKEAREQYADKKFFSEGGWRAALAQPQLYELAVGGIINAMIEGGKRISTSYGR